MLRFPCLYRRHGILTYLETPEEFELFNEQFKNWGSKDVDEHRESFSNVMKVVNRQMKNVVIGATNITN